MDQKELFIKFWEKEAPAMRQVISRIPEGSDYRPDPKSRMAREIAWLIVHEQTALVDGLERGKIEWSDTPAPATMKEIVDAYDALNARSGARLRALDAATWEKDLPFLYEGQEAFRSPGYDMAWSF